MDAGQEWPHLQNAPITEALIDIRVQLPQGTVLSHLAEFRDQVADRYPGCRERRRFHGKLSFKASDPPVVDVAEEAPDGYLMTSADGRQVVQARLDGFTFSRLRPYETWEHLRSQAKSLWRIYRQALRPVRVVRIAVRYINRIEIPVPVGDLKEWILTGPELAPGLPQSMAGYFFRFHLPFEQPRGFVNVIQKIDLEPTDPPDCVSLIFDVDAFLPLEKDPSNDEMWVLFENLRLIKNRVFFDSTTSKTLELFR